MFKNPAGMWECLTCMIQNKSDASKCVACKTCKPGTAVPNVPTTQETRQTSLAAMFKKPEGNWECDTCMVQNKGTATKCLACETPKPGVKPTTNFTSPGGFKFGASGGFTFCSQSKDNSKPAVDGPFKVGAPATSTTDSKSNANSGSRVSTKKMASDSNSTASGGFHFKASSDKTDPTPSGGGFKFGVPVRTEQKPDIGKPTMNKAPTNEEKPAVGGFKFVAPTETNKSDTPAGFTLGANTGKIKESSSSSDIKGLFNSSNNNKEKATAAGGFKVESITNKVNTSSPAGGFNLTTSSSSDTKSTNSGFSFGTSSSITAKKKDKPNENNNKPAMPSFQYGQASSANDFSISDNSTKPPPSLFQFEQDSSQSDTTTATKPVFGGLGSSANSISSTSTTTSETKPATPFFFGVNKPQEDSKAPPSTNSGGFTFGASGSSSTASMFGATTMTTASSSQGDTTKPAASTPTLFTFGVKPTGTTNVSEVKPLGSSFSFNAPKPADASGPNTQNLFAFKGPQAGSDMTSKPGGFNLGKRSGDSSTDSPSKKGKDGPGINPFTNGGSTPPAFGAFVQNSSTSSVFGSSTTSGPAQTFGSNRSSGPFGVSSTAPPASAFNSASFQFGQANNTQQNNTSSGAGVFHFGQSYTNNAVVAPAASTGSSPFVFGQQTAAPSQPATTAATPGGGFNFSTSAPTNFNFAGGHSNPTAAPSSSAAPFQFGAGTAPPAASINPFNATSAAPPRRPIKKAARKLRK